MLLLTLSTPGVHVGVQFARYAVFRYFSAKFYVFLTHSYVTMATKYCTYLGLAEKPVPTVLHWGPRGPQTHQF